MGVSGADNTVPFNAGVRNLAGDVTVAQTDNQTILRGVVFVLVLEDQTLAGIVIGLALTTPAEPDLITLEVLLVLYNLHETLKMKTKSVRRWPTHNLRLESFHANGHRNLQVLMFTLIPVKIA